MEGHSSSASDWKARQEKGLSHSRTYIHTLSPLNCKPQCFVDLKSGDNPFAFDVEVVHFANFEQLRRLN
jgi:hypothetical protein